MYLFNIRRKYMPGGSIVKRSVATATVSLPKNSYTYTGEAITPTVTVRLGDMLLTVNEDYTVTYSGNTDVGMATVTITGMGNFYGTATIDFYITSSAGGWAGFDLSNLGDAVANIGLKDSGASFNSQYNINTQNLQVLPDGRLHFGGELQGHAYIWGFDEGHPFEVEHFKSAYDSRGDAVTYFGSSILSGDGSSGYFCQTNNAGLVPFTLSTAYDLSTRSTSDAIGMASGYALHMAFSADGTKFFNKGSAAKNDNNVLYCRHLTTPFDASAFDEQEVTSANLNTVAGDNLTWRAFFFSPDGRNMVATSGSGLGLVHKFSLSTPWDISTLARTSYKQIFASGAELDAVAVNASGTKMIVFNNYDDMFYEYNLA